MIRVSVLYPAKEGGAFDHEYYATKHAPMVVELLAPLGLQGGEVNVGVSGAPGTPAPFVAASHLLFNTIEDFEKAFGAHGQEIMADIPNYSNIEPQIQISEIVE